MKIETQKIIARNLRLLRAKCAVSQVRMAVDVGLTRLLYAAYESGKTTPDAEVLYKLAQRHGIKMNYFFIENEQDYLTAISGGYYYDDTLALLVQTYDKLSNFAKGMLIERANQLLEQDKIIQKNREALEKKKPKKPGSPDNK